MKNTPNPFEAFQTLMLIFLLVSSHTSFAQDQSEYFVQAAPEEILLTLGMSHSSARVRLGQEKTEETTTTTSLELEYGLPFDNLSLVLEIGLSRFEDRGAEQKWEQQGLEDPALSVNWKKALPLGYFQMGISYSFSPEPQKIDSEGRAKNLYSGSDRLAPFIGWSYSINRYSTGLFYTQEVLLGDQSIQNDEGSIIRRDGGEAQELAAFFERGFESGRLGISLGFEQTANLVDKGSRDSEASPDMIHSSVYGVKTLSEHFGLSGEIVWHQVAQNDFQGQEFSDQENWTAGLGLDFNY